MPDDRIVIAAGNAPLDLNLRPSGKIHNFINFFRGCTITSIQTTEYALISGSILFDPQWYLAAYADLSEDTDAARHYIEYGASEGRNPHPLFDTRYYLEQCPTAAESGLTPLAHYLIHGSANAKNPHPLFDACFYLEQVTDKPICRITPLEHYLQTGTQAGLNPNPFFDTKWYTTQQDKVRLQGLNPLIHYVTVGEKNRVNPSLRFEVDWYLRCNLDVARAGIGPLYHFLRSGKIEGREPCRAHGLLGAASDANILCIKRPSLQPEIALFVTHSANGKLRPHVPFYLSSLIQRGVTTVLIVATDEQDVEIREELSQWLNGIYVRQNIGFDFAAWAHVISLNPDFYNAKILYLINDSVFGPTSAVMFDGVLQQIRKSASDFVGLTDSYECCWHLQSFFLAFKEEALSSIQLRNFFDSVESFEKKTSVIAEYETKLALTLMNGGLKCETIFPQEGSAEMNRTLHHWKALLHSGFPFLKVSTVRDTHPDVDVSDWREVLSSQGYDVSLAERTVSADLSGTKVRSVEQTGQKNQFAQLEFDPDFYLSVYPDIREAGVDPLRHYNEHGRAEGRLPSMPRVFDALQPSVLRRQARESILIVSHEGVRGGAPMVAYTLTQLLLKKYNVVVLFLAAGPLIDACRASGAMVVGPVGLAGSMELNELVVKRIVESVPLKYAIVNSIASRFVLQALANHFVPTLTLIHEFSSYIRPRGAFQEVAFWSGDAIFSADITRDNALAESPEIAARDYRIIPQGRCIIPQDHRQVGNAHLEEKVRVANILRPKGRSPGMVTVIGAGLVEYRKGVDLFVECAAKAINLAPDVDWNFVWIGRGFMPDNDVGYSVYIADQIRRHGIEDRVSFLDEVNDLAAAFGLADLLVLSSRLDPLPNVAIDALSAGLPMVCFAKTTGIASMFVEQKIDKETVADYLDVSSMAEKVVSLARSGERRSILSSECIKIAKLKFSAERYIEELEHAAVVQIARAQQEHVDVQTILKSDLPQLDFYSLRQSKGEVRADLIRRYVRSWASGIGCRKLFPGFHPGIYREMHGLSDPCADPLADFLRAGEPKGPWRFPVIRPNNRPKPIPAGTRIGLHLHAYHLNVVPEILERLLHNAVRPDLLVSVKSNAARDEMRERLSSYQNGRVLINLVPDPGRDVGPFLTEFGSIMQQNYDLIGHLHTKTSADLKDSSVAKIWVKFLLDNVLGRINAPMADIILGEMANNPRIGLVFPDDPHVVGWDKNRSFVEQYSSAFSLTRFPDSLHFPVGAMFWARPRALKPMFDLGLEWNDYPAEPLPYDGSLLHGLERLYGLAATQSGFEIWNTNVPGVTR
ncbi:rhamnan synthesis F family protein [Methylocystis sp. Sn-Cys]|uniref:rhamnan synthesis F family protein n=1 Tax=Methylocystis sp. Sn-Cys TaxID=1701263 RepID=UPI0019217D8D|nr:rhamnan synthesis F family protein [Methylocystis sp. Sn-Cys]MBL1258889.1 glycosyltransferase [Methylocystis sp. Sn-Cys]